MALWNFGQNKKSKEKPLPLQDIWAQAAHNMQTVSYDKFVSSLWQPISDDAAHQSIYREASHTNGHGWTIREWTEDKKGCVVAEVKIPQCDTFAALQSIGEFESTQSTDAAGMPHEKRDEPASATSKHYIEMAHEHALFVDADGMVYFNNGGTPVNAEGMPFTKEELALVSALAAPTVTGSRSTDSIIPLFSGINNFALNNVPGSSNMDSVNRSVLGLIFKDVIHHLEQVQKFWTRKSAKWTVSTARNYDNTFLQFYNALNVIEDHEGNSDTDFQHIRKNLNLTVQALYTTWFIQTMKHEDLAGRFLHDSIKEKFGYSTKKSEWRKCPDKEIDKLKEMLEATQKNIDEHGNYSPLLTIFTQNYTPKEYSELFDKALKAIKKQAENLKNPTAIGSKLKEISAENTLPAPNKATPS